MHDRRGHRSVPVSRLLASLAVAWTVAACGQSTPSPTPGGASPGPTSGQPTLAPTVAASPGVDVTAGPTQAAGAPACTPADLKASHGLVEGAPGSRLTEVVLTSASTCSVDAFPALGLRDADGTAIVGSPSAGPGRIDLVAGAAYTSAVRVSNWCTPEPAYPVQLEIRLGAEELAVTGTSFPEEGDLPPCNGSTDVNPILEGGAWTPST